MFTGIVESTGTITARETSGDDLRLTIETDIAGDDLHRGDSVSVSGVCLTVETIEPPAFTVFLAAETREVTYLDTLEVGDAVNIERPLAASGRLDGHIVQGHVDGMIKVIDRWSIGEDWRYVFELPPEYAPYIVMKGSIALDGISLTVAERAEDRFEVAIIPETYNITTLSEKTPGDLVHLEVDVIARYVERQLQADPEQRQRRREELRY